MFGGFSAQSAENQGTVAVLQNLISMLDTARHGYSAAMKEQVEKTPGCKPLLVAQRFRLLDGMRALFRGVLYLVTVARAHVGVSDGSVRLPESLRVRTSKLSASFAL